MTPRCNPTRDRWLIIVHRAVLRSACVATVLDSALTLLVFTPVLLELGKQVTPPWSADTGDGWLVLVAVAGAVGGLAVSAFVGRHFNPRSSADLRSK